MDRATGKREELTQPGEEYYLPRYSPDGARLATLAGNDLRVGVPKGARRIVMTPAKGEGIRGYAWVSDEGMIVLAGDSSAGTAYRLKLDGSTPTKIVSNVDAIAIAP